MAVARKPKGFKVTAPLVQVRFSDRAVQFYYGDILPDGVSDESIEHLKSLGYVEEINAPTESGEK